MKDYKQRYLGRVIKVFLDSGWAFAGVLELEMCNKKMMVLNSAGRLYDIPVEKISAVQLNAEPPREPLPERITRTETQQPQGYDLEQGAGPGTGGVVARPPEREPSLLEKYLENEETHYGSIIPNDLLIGDDDHGTTRQVDFAIGMAEMRNPEISPQQWEIEDEDGSE